MKTARREKILAITLALSLILSLIVVFTVAGSAAGSANQYTLKVSDLSTFPAGAKDNGDYEKAGTNDFFTIIYSDKAKVEGSEKTFSDGQFSSKRISWGDKTTVGDDILNAIMIKTQGSGTVKIWWICGGNVTDSSEVRQVALFDANGNVVSKSNITNADAKPDDADGVKNDLFITELNIPKDGIYYIGNTGGSNYFYQIQVTDNQDGPAPADRADWAGVSAPVITSAVDNGTGSIVVDVNALIGHDGADELLVSMYKGEELIATKGSVIEKGSHKLVFNPADSGTYTFKAEISRSGCESKASASVDAKFVYVLSVPYLSSATSIGGGSVELIWKPVHEAEKYNIFVNGEKVATADGSASKHVISGLNIGEEYTFSVSAVRGSEEKKGGTLSTLVTVDRQITWAFTAYGPSTSADKNGYIGNLNEDGQVTVYANDNGGKIQPEKNDGLSFYYTAVPTDYNFTIRAKVTINSWALSNGQEGFGLMAMDRLPVSETDAYDYWNNSYLAGSTKIEYKYNADTDTLVDNKVVDDSLKKFSMKCGIGSISRTGATPDNIDLLAKGDSETIKTQYTSRYYPLDRTAADISNMSGTYNVLGNYTGNKPAGTFEDRFLITEYIMEIQKSNTGYLISYYNAATEELIAQKQYYDPEALNQLDPDFVYVGFFASRNANITFSDVEFSTIACADDADRVYPPTEYVTPTVSVASGEVTTSRYYELIIDTNVAGYLTVKLADGTAIAENEKIDLYERFRVDLTLYEYDENPIKIEFTPDPYQDLGEYVELSSTKTLYVTHNLMYNRGNYHRKTIYISPDVAPYTTTADGTKENPFDIFTALENAYPGQTLILMEGTYKPGAALKIARGMDGTAENPIRLIADPEATTRPVIDFEGLWNGFTHAGDYWYFYGFDITGSKDMQKGFQISGSYNILDQIHAYENGNTGIQLSRLSGSDSYADWPSYNLILNCTSYRNHDGGFEDADGFAAKLTVGPGNIFDGCIAYHNADDGWDLYAKVSTGPIGAVTIRNCIAYENGFVPGAGSKTGNGNGFKLGGESISGKHVLENSIAFNNLAKGIDCNSCPDIRVYDCISFNNGNYNVAFYTNSADNTAFIANGVISFRTENTSLGENLKPKGTQVVEDYMNNTTFYWNTDNNACMNTAGQKITADMFVSLEFTGWTRNEDGTINLHGFLELKDTIPAEAQNCKLGGTASSVIVLEEDDECSFSKGWFKEDKYAHWHVCECGNKSHVEEHDFMWIIDKAQVGNMEGLKHQECTVCGYKKAAVTIYPPKPADPVEPNEPEIPVIPDQQPSIDANTQPEQLGFFARIWQAIVNFFRNLFGIKEKAYIPQKEEYWL